jgi:flagellar biogenesis protein FliO
MPTSDYLRSILSLLTVLGLMVGFLFALKYLSQKYDLSQWGAKLTTRTQKRLRIIETQVLDTRHRLLIAQRDDVEYVLAISPDRVTVLDKYTSVSTLVSPLDESPGHPS